MASPRERDYRTYQPQLYQQPRSYQPSYYQQAQPQSRLYQPSYYQPYQQTYRRHHFHDVPPGPHQRYGDYVVVEGHGWWPRWYPYWDRRWYDYWWSLYDYYGGDARPEYAEYARDAILRQYAPQWGMNISGWVGADPQQRGSASQHGAPSLSPSGIVPRHGAPVLLPGGIIPRHGAPSLGPGHDDRYRQRYHHPHDYYGDYSVINGTWWPRWFPYWDPNWIQYWQQLYYYYGGDMRADYAQYARDAYLRAQARQWGWI